MPHRNRRGQKVQHGQAAENAGCLVAMERRLFMEAQGQIAVTPDFAAEHEHVPRAVHGFHAHLFALGFDKKHVLPIVRPVP